MNFFEILKVLVLGIVEGFTEWLPISSTGHMILVDEIIHLNVSEAFREVFMVVIQLGAILAVVVLYFHKLNPFSPRKTQNQKRATIRLWMKIVVACIPAAVIGLPFDNLLDKLMNGYVVSAMLILYGVFFIVLENRNRGVKFRIQRVTQISFQTAAVIGLFQVLAMVPGTSRSGATILGAMLLGCSRGAAAEFSFFLGIPVMFGASLLKIVKFMIEGAFFQMYEIFYLIFGMAVAFGVSVYSIKFLMEYVKQHDFKFFGYYRIVLGIIVLSYFGISALVTAA
jgi:undecaprenyl-diphosphatase